MMLLGITSSSAYSCYPSECSTGTYKSDTLYSSDTCCSNTIGTCNWSLYGSSYEYECSSCHSNCGSCDGGNWNSCLACNTASSLPYYEAGLFSGGYCRECTEDSHCDGTCEDNVCVALPAACTTMSSCTGGGTSRFDYGNSFSYNDITYYCCNSNGDMCTSSSTESECPTPESSPSSSPPPPPTAASPPPPPPTAASPPPPPVAQGCGDGESMSVSSEYRCCSVNHDIVAYKYSVDGGTHDDNIKFTVENDEGTIILDSGGTCDITNSGTQCAGSACTSATNNNCQKPKATGIEAQKVCVVLNCNNWSDNCQINAWTVDFYTAASPTAASPPPAASAGLTSDAPNSLTLYLSWVAASIMLMFAC